MLAQLFFSRCMVVLLMATSCSMTFSMEPLEDVSKVVALRDCRICFDEKSEAEFTTLACGHQGICTGCHQDNVARALQRNTAGEMREGLQCTFRSPNQADPLNPIRCHHVMNEVDIRAITNDEASVTQYSDKLLLEMLNTDRSLKRCPTPGCQDGYSLPEYSLRASISEAIVGTPAIQCRSCNQEYCPHCQMVHSRYALCPIANNGINNNNNAVNNNNNDVNNGAAPVDFLEQNVQAFKNWMGVNNAKSCPSCHGIIQKNDGCRHMTHKASERGCGYEFCWDCLIPWIDHGTGPLYPEKYDCKAADLARAGVPLEISFIDQCVDGARYVVNSQWVRHIRDRRVIFVLLVCTVAGSVGYKILTIMKKQ
jgi:ariadne-1